MAETMNHSMKGRYCLITGATSGIGYCTALNLARMGAVVVVGGRSRDRAVKTVEDIRLSSENQGVYFITADLSDQSQVRFCAQEYIKQFPRLDVLVNNAGAIFFNRRISRDGIEKTFALNYCTPFLLTHLLLDLIKQSGSGRIINVSSAAHVRAAIDFEDLGGKKRYGAMRAYGQSKLALILFTYELARRLGGDATVTVNALHPGFVATNFGGNNGWLIKLLAPLAKLFALSPEKGAIASTYLASSPEVAGVTGKYFVNQQAVASSPRSYDEIVGRRLWDITVQITGMDK
jgi:NAD(P)-dependent dehydrogenase (short-subunit alcohol dehydrogenase family)